MKKALLLGLLVLAQSAFADDAFTPAKIKQNASLDPDLNAIGSATEVSYVTGVVNSMLALQNNNLAPRLLCFPATVQAVDVKNAILAADATTFANTNEGGVIFIASTLVNKFPCTQTAQPAK